MLKISSLFFSVLVAVFAVTTAHAAASQASMNKMLNRIENLCDYKVRIACKAPLGARNYKGGKLQEMQDFKKFQDQANEYAQVWADTILEGPYISIGETELINVAEIYDDAHLVAYRITFQEPGIDTDSCQGPNKNPEKDPTCTHGFIMESVVFSPDMSVSGNLKRDEVNFYPTE